jgi:hypothetical protein
MPTPAGRGSLVQQTAPAQVAWRATAWRQAVISDEHRAPRVYRRQARGFEVHARSIDRLFSNARPTPEICCYPLIRVLVDNGTSEARYGPSHAPRHQPRFSAVLRDVRAMSLDVLYAWPYLVGDRAALA